MNRNQSINRKRPVWVQKRVDGRIQEFKTRKAAFAAARRDHDRYGIAFATKRVQPS